MPRHYGDFTKYMCKMYEIHFVQFNKTNKGFKAQDACMKRCYEKEEVEDIVKQFFELHDKRKYAVEVYYVTDGNHLTSRPLNLGRTEDWYSYRTEYIQSPIRPFTTDLFEGEAHPNRPIYEGVIN